MWNIISAILVILMFLVLYLCVHFVIVIVVLIQEKTKEHKDKKHKQIIAQYFASAALNYKNKEYKKSIYYYTKLIEIESNDAIWYNNRGLAYRKLNNFDHALSDYNKAIQLHPTSINIENRAELFILLNQVEDALRDFNSAKDLGSNTASLRRKEINQSILLNEINISHDVRIAHRNTLSEQSEYANLINQIHTPSFQKIRQVSNRYLQNKNEEVKKRFRERLENEYEHGRLPIDDPNILMQYLYSYGNMHECKLHNAFEALFHNNRFKGLVDIIDWGCGQALASTVLLDYISQQQIPDFFINTIKLIEPSEIATKRGVLHLNKLLQKNHLSPIIKICNKNIQNLDTVDIYTLDSNIKIHLFSNIIDINELSLNQLEQLIFETQRGINYFICVSPYINAISLERLDSFENYFKNNYDCLFDSIFEVANSAQTEDSYWNCNNNYIGLQGIHCTHPECGCANKWTRIIRVFKCEI